VLVGAGIFKRFGAVRYLTVTISRLPSEPVGIDGSAPGADHGADTEADGRDVVNAYLPYQLIRDARRASS
jgi:hypothetical protein